MGLRTGQHTISIHLKCFCYLTFDSWVYNTRNMPRAIVKAIDQIDFLTRRGSVQNATNGIVGLYVLYLEVIAVKAVHRCSWGEAAAAFLMPTILLILLCGLLFVGLMRVAGPSINEFMQQLQQMTP